MIAKLYDQKQSSGCWGLERRTAGVLRVMEPFWMVVIDTQLYASVCLTERFTVEGRGWQVG